TSGGPDAGQPNGTASPTTRHTDAGQPNGTASPTTRHTDAGQPNGTAASGSTGTLGAAPAGVPWNGADRARSAPMPGAGTHGGLTRRLRSMLPWPTTNDPVGALVRAHKSIHPGGDAALLRRA